MDNDNQKRDQLSPEATLQCFRIHCEGKTLEAAIKALRRHGWKVTAFQEEGSQHYAIECEHNMFNELGVKYFLAERLFLDSVDPELCGTASPKVAEARAESAENDIPEAAEDFTADDAAARLATIARVLRIARYGDLEARDVQALLNVLEPEVERVLAMLNEIARRV